MLAEHLNVDHGLVDVAELDSPEQALDPVDDFQSATVAERENQGETVVLCCGLNRSVELLLANVRQISQSADGLKANIFLEEFGRFFFQELLKQFH